MTWASLLSLLVILTAALLPYAHCHETALHGRVFTPHHPPSAHSTGHLLFLPAFESHADDHGAAERSHDHCIHFLTEDAGIGNPVPTVAGPSEMKFLLPDADPLPCQDLPARPELTQRPQLRLDGFRDCSSGLSPPSRQMII